VAVAPGQRVRKGEVIAFVGATGEATGPHVHYQIMLNGRPIDPLPYLNGVPARVLATLPGVDRVQSAMIPCELYAIVAWLLNLYIIIMLVYALVSWVPSLRGRWTDYVAMLVEPVLAPVRRIIPPMGGLDISFLVVIIVIQLVVRLAQTSACAY
jgi:uncharacterized protein YggT (Ycf19 family)